MAKRKYTAEKLIPIVNKSHSLAEVLRQLNLKLSGGSYRLIQQRIKEYAIDTSHFTGQGWSKNQTKETNVSIKSQSEKIKIPDEEVFKENSGYPSSKLRKRLLDIGWEEKCNICGLIVWLNQPIRLHVDHINGIASDHRKSNLRFLCPNCHQQTDTWGNKGM